MHARPAILLQWVSDLVHDFLVLLATSIRACLQAGQGHDAFVIPGAVTRDSLNIIALEDCLLPARHLPGGPPELEPETRKFQSKF